VALREPFGDSIVAEGSAWEFAKNEKTKTVNNKTVNNICFIP
jgi:hypothetical protein